MKHYTLRITLSLLLTVAAFVFLAQLFIHNLDSDQRFFLIVQALLFIFLAAANYTDRNNALLGHHRTHVAILIILAIVLSINGYLILSKDNTDAAILHLSHQIH
ncbi:MAG: hypothetical protein KA160_08975 [Lacibacter sp.]|nr:hypothetical protein [Lacibacter sp.]